MIEEQSEPVVLRMLAYGEARGEGGIGILAVLHVVMNRALKLDTTLKHEALRKRQFSCFNDEDPNRRELLMADIKSPNIWSAIDAICEVFERGFTLDPTKGASHYYVEHMENPPAWGRGHPDWKETAVLGHHVFGVAA
jgi:spore germination cell wall hydrolase CwlJ-like protein